MSKISMKKSEFVQKENNSQKTGTVKGIKVKSGIDGIRLLDPKDSKSWVLWSEEVSSYIKANHHLMGNVFKENSYKKLFVATNNDDIVNEAGETIEMTKSQKTMVEKERINQFLKDQHEMNVQKVKVMGVIMLTISAESKHMLEVLRN